MTGHDTATLLWFLWYGGLAFLVVLGVTAIVEHFWPDL